MVIFEKHRNEDGDGPLVEKTDYDLLWSPLPPTNLRNWAVDYLVKANESDGWWRGAVEHVLSAQGYHVLFLDTKLVVFPVRVRSGIHVTNEGSFSGNTTC